MGRATFYSDRLAVEVYLTRVTGRTREPNPLPLPEFIMNPAFVIVRKIQGAHGEADRQSQSILLPRRIRQKPQACQMIGRCERRGAGRLLQDDEPLGGHKDSALTHMIPPLRALPIPSLGQIIGVRAGRLRSSRLAGGVLSVTVQRHADRQDYRSGGEQAS